MSETPESAVETEAPAEAAATQDEVAEHAAGGGGRVRRPDGAGGAGLGRAGEARRRPAAGDGR